MATLNEPEERTNLIVLGRLIGTYTDWDSGDTSEGFQVYDFEPIGVLVNYLPKGKYVFINYGNGMFEYHNDGGDLDTSIDMIEIARMISREYSETVTFTQPEPWSSEIMAKSETVFGDKPVDPPFHVMDTVGSDITMSHADMVAMIAQVWPTLSQGERDGIIAASVLGSRAAIPMSEPWPDITRADVAKAHEPWPTKADIDTVLSGGSIPVTFDDERDDAAEDMQALQDRDRE